MKLYGTYLFLGIDNTHMGPMCSIYIVLLWWSKETAKNDNHIGLEKRISGAFSWLLYNCGQTFSPTFIEQGPLKNHMYSFQNSTIEIKIQIQLIPIPNCL